MKVLVDDRIGSRELLKPLRRAGCEAQLTRLDFADVAWSGNGPSGLVKVGVERKKVDEMVGAIQDPRFVSRQLPGLLSTYGIAWLVIEGQFRQGREGELLVGYGRDAGFTRQRILYDTFIAFLTSIEVNVVLKANGRLRVWRTSGWEDTVAWVAAERRWWHKRWQDHGTFKVVDEANVGSVGFEAQSFKRSVFAQLPGVYHTRSLTASRHLGSIFEGIAGRRMLRLDRERLLKVWRGVPGIGPKTAARIVTCIGEEDK